MLRLELPTLLRQNGRFMGTSFSPTRQDVERYRSLRALSMERNHRIIKTIPRQAPLAGLQTAPPLVTAAAPSLQAHTRLRSRL